MNLNDLMKTPLNTLLLKTNVTSVKPVADNEGNIIKIIVEYEPSQGVD